MFEQTIQAGVFVPSGFRLSRGEHYAENKCEVLPDRRALQCPCAFFRRFISEPEKLVGGFMARYGSSEKFNFLAGRSLRGQTCHLCQRDR